MARRGRPPLGDQAATDALRIRVTHAQRLDLEQVARENRMSVSGVVREAVNTFVADYREATVFPVKHATDPTR